MYEKNMVLIVFVVMMVLLNFNQLYAISPDWPKEHYIVFGVLCLIRLISWIVYIVSTVIYLKKTQDVRKEKIKTIIIWLIATLVINLIIKYIWVYY